MIGSLTFVIGCFIRDEGKLIKQIVSEVSENLKRQHLDMTLSTSGSLVGMGYHVTEMTRLLEVGGNNVRMVGICGANGIGKTTISRVLYNQLARLFQYCIFLENIRTDHEDLVHLQKELLSHVLKHECHDIKTVDAGINLIKDTFKNKKVLIVLDDVDQRSQLNAIAGDCDWFGEGSRIIVTARKRYVFPTEGKALIYKPKEMDCNDSLQLLSKHAFRNNHPPRDYYKLSTDMASILMGMPLPLKIIGSFLFGKSSTVWEDMSKKLSESTEAQVKEKLRMIYEALDHEQQQIFLDIACFLNGVDKRIAHYMWDDCDFYPGNGIGFLCLCSTEYGR